MKRAVVTGAASGIGLAAARRLRERGCAVVGVDRDEERLRAGAEEAGFEPVPADVASGDGRDLIAREAGSCDYLVNGAGVIDVARIEDATEAQWERMFAINAQACFFLTQRLAGQLAAGGAVVNVSSMAAKTAEAEAAIYAATKAAVLSMTRSFAKALAPAVRVNAVCPGIIDTPMQDAFLPSFAAWAGKDEQALQVERVEDVPARRMGTADDVAALICFLLSDDASYITGDAFNVTGGLVYW